MSNKKLTYFIDTDDEKMYLDIFNNMSLETAKTIYNISKNEKAGTHLSNKARTLTFEKMSYKNLRYLIIGCERAGAELRVKALATFIYRANLSAPLAPLISNDKLIEMMNKSLKKYIETIYKWSGLNIKEENA